VGIPALISSVPVAPSRIIGRGKGKAGNNVFIWKSPFFFEKKFEIADRY
jgi:hypothetical protein